MNKLLTLGLSSVVSFSLLSCAPYTPQNARTSTGANLDKPASGERSARETRYLEQEVVQSQGNPPATTIDPNIPLDPNAPVSSDPAQIQAPNTTGTMPPPPPTTAEAPPPPTTQDTPPPPAQTPSTPTATELPYGVPVPGKKGFVYSPYDKSAGFVDVRDISPGTKVRCPYTGKIFRVP